MVTSKENHKVKKLNQLGLPFLTMAWKVYVLVVS